MHWTSSAYPAISKVDIHCYNGVDVHWMSSGYLLHIHLLGKCISTILIVAYPLEVAVDMEWFCPVDIFVVKDPPVDIHLQ